MRKLWSSIIKELILLKRDLLGFAIIFLMPVVLIITITYIQNEVEKSSQQSKFPIVVVNQDDGALAENVIANLEKGNNFKIISKIDGKKITADKGLDLIRSGKQKVLVTVPVNFSKNVQQQIDTNVDMILKQVVPGESSKSAPTAQSTRKVSTQIVKLYFDPALNDNIRTWVKRGINDMVSRMETKSVYKTFERKFNANLEGIVGQSLISFQEFPINNQQKLIVPNAVQHNLPAWTLFAIFFIILPLSINIVKEKNQGTFIRLKTLPASSFTFILSKIIVYLLVCMIQFYLMLLISIYLFPVIGLPHLDVHGKMLGLSVVALFSGLAAIGFGVLIGTFAKTHEQAAPFGATSVVILAAIGGLWFPIYAMPHSLQMIARISPMNWGLEGFYNVLLRNTDWSELWLYLLLLFAFFLLNMVIVLLYEKKINRL